MTDTKAQGLRKEPIQKPSVRQATKKASDPAVTAADSEQAAFEADSVSAASPPEPDQEEGYSPMLTSKIEPQGSDAQPYPNSSAISEVVVPAQEAVETAARLSTELADMAKGNVEAAIASVSALGRAAVGLGDEFVEYGRANFQQASASYRRLAEIKSPSDLLRLQSEYACASLDIIMAESSRMKDILGELIHDVTQPFTDHFAAQAEITSRPVA